MKQKKIQISLQLSTKNIERLDKLKDSLYLSRGDVVGKIIKMIFNVCESDNPKEIKKSLQKIMDFREYYNDNDEDFDDDDDF